MACSMLQVVYIAAGMCIDSAGKLYYHNGTAVVEVGTGSGGGIDHATADGAYYASRNGAWASLAGRFASPLGTDDNYVTSMRRKLSNLSGTTMVIRTWLLCSKRVQY